MVTPISSPTYLAVFVMPRQFPRLSLETTWYNSHEHCIPFVGIEVVLEILYELSSTGQDM